MRLDTPFSHNPFPHYEGGHGRPMIYLHLSSGSEWKWTPATILIYLPSLPQQQRCRPPLTSQTELAQLLKKMKDKSFEPSGQFPISFQTEFDIIYTSSLFMKPNPQKNVENRWKVLEQTGKCISERQESRGLAALTLTDYGLTFGVRASEMSDGL